MSFAAAARHLLQSTTAIVLVGSNTWVNGRSDDHENLMREARRWLGDLPPAVARRIARDNGAALFGLPVPQR